MKSKADPLNVGHWYRIKGQVVYCTRYEVDLKSKPAKVRLQGIRPQDYAAYITHYYIGEKGEQPRTVAQIEDIPYPELIKVGFSVRTKFEELSKQEALT